MIQHYSENEIIAALGKKDRKVFHYLFESYFRQLVLFGEYFLLDRTEAEDIVQEVFLGLWNRAETSPITHLKSYLFTQVRNRCLNRIKHLNVAEKHNEWIREAFEYAEMPEIEMDENRIKHVYQAIEQLPPRARTIFTLCVVEGKTYKEVAKELGISVNTVNMQMKRAYKFLRTRLGILLFFFINSL